MAEAGVIRAAGKDRGGLTPDPALVPRSFYARSPDLVARNLLGKLLVRPAEANGPSRPDMDLVGRIVELEAYFGDADPAAHAFRGKTARNAVLFGPPGHAYVYFIYGMYFCLNVSCEPENRAGCVLVRALEPLAGMQTMILNRRPDALANGASRSPERVLRELTSGPGRLCKAFAITRAGDNGADFTSPSSPLQIRDDGFVPGKILTTPRIGIRKAEERMARYLVGGSKFVSRG